MLLHGEALRALNGRLLFKVDFPPLIVKNDNLSCLVFCEECGTLLPMGSWCQASAVDNIVKTGEHVRTFFGFGSKKLVICPSSGIVVVDWWTSCGHG